MDLQKYTSSALERSLADSHFQLTRSILESEFQLAEIESKDIPQPDSNSVMAPATQADQTLYEKAAADVWKIYHDVEEASKRLETARQNLKKATTAESFRRAQQVVDQAQKELDLANKKLDLAGSTLEIEDYERKKMAPQLVESHSLAEHLQALREELFPPSPKANPNPAIQPKVAEEANAEINALVLFKTDMGAFQRMYSFLSQIFDYGNTRSRSVSCSTVALRLCSNSAASAKLST